MPTRPVAAINLAAAIGERIASPSHPDYRIGRALPPQGAIGEDFGVSSKTVRRALDILAENGAVTPRRRGAGVLVIYAPPGMPTAEAGPRHGHVSTYNRGCHCDRCAEAKRLSKQAKKKLPLTPGGHGKSTNYNRGCRCPDCYAWQASRNGGQHLRGPLGTYGPRGGPMNITVDQLKTLWTDGRPIPRGPEHSPVTRDDLRALATGLDLDDGGQPSDDDWDALADQVNGIPAGAVTDDRQADALEDVEDAARDMAAAGDRRDRAIRAAIAARVPVVRIAAAADLSIPRIYQIRDGRR